MARQKDRDRLDNPGKLRRRAESAWGSRGSAADKLSEEEVCRLIYELEVHQSELEIQNEEMHRIQEELVNARDKYADLYDFAPIGYLTISENGRILQANLTAAKLLGIDREILLGKWLPQFIVSDDQDVYYQHRRAVIATKTQQTCEVKMVTGGGTPFAAAMLSTGMADVDGTVVRWRTVISDVTAHKQVEQALRLRDRAIAAAANGIILTDWTQPINPIIYCNPAFEKITGYTKDEAIGLNARFLQGDDREQEGLKKVRTAIQEGYECHEVVRNYKKDGTLFYNELTISPVPDEKGKVTHFVGIMNDITERRRYEEALVRERDFAESLIETAQVIILVLDTKGRILRFNSFMEHLSGYRLQEVRGKDWFETFLPRCDRMTVKELFSKAGSGAQTRGNVNPIITRDGRRRDIEWWDKVLKDSDNQTLGLIAIGHDVTERREREAQLLQAQKMEVVGQLTGCIAHDFNNLLTIILGNLGLLTRRFDEACNPDIREFLDDALSAAREGADLTHRLLVLSRKQALEQKQTDINKKLDDLARFLRRLLGESIKLRIRGYAKAVMVCVDPGQLESTLLNLAINARDAMPQGGTLTLDVTRQHLGDEEATSLGLTPGSYVIVSVSDTGNGMSPEVLSHIIEPFFTTKQIGKGTGLGLSMAYNFAKQSGGHLQFKSTLGKGTNVSLILPESELISGASVSKEGGNGLPGGSETILIVEDESRVRKLAKRRLQELGYQILEAENAMEAKEILMAETTVGLLFSDIIMPGEMSGIDLAHWAMRTKPELKVLLTTGAIHKGNGEKERVSTMDYPLLRKPYTQKILAKTIRSLLDQ